MQNRFTMGNAYGAYTGLGRLWSRRGVDSPALSCARRLRSASAAGASAAAESPPRKVRAPKWRRKPGRTQKAPGAPITRRKQVPCRPEGSRTAGQHATPGRSPKTSPKKLLQAASASRCSRTSRRAAAASCAATAAPHPHRTSRHPAAAGRCRLVRRRRAGSARAATWGDNAHSAKGPARQNQGVPEGFSAGCTGS